MFSPEIMKLLLSTFLYSYFSAGILGSIGACLAQKYFGPSTLFFHGKAAKTISTKPQCQQYRYRYKWQQWMASLLISKQYFWHFYAFGIIFSTVYCAKFGYNNAATSLLAIQCFRRLIECFWVMPGAKESKMHLIHYLIGISYYPILLISFKIQQSNDTFSVSLSFACWIALFIAASFLQSYCHWILGSERKNIKNELNSSLHRPINNYLFKLIHAPHYTAEFLIYLSIAGVQRFPIHPLSYMNLVWILTILGVSAKNSSDWLCETWKYKSRKDFCKYIIVPFLF